MVAYTIQYMYINATCVHVCELTTSTRCLWMDIYCLYTQAVFHITDLCRAYMLHFYVTKLSITLYFKISFFGLKGTQKCEFFGFDFKFCTISL
jgi:hypothetical protein